MQNEFIKKYGSKISGVIRCYDRVVLKGTLMTVGHAGAMMHYLNRKGILYKDYVKFAAPYREQIRERAKEVSRKEGIRIEYLRQPKKVRKEDIVKEYLKGKEKQEGLVCVLSAMEPCQTYVYGYNKQKKYSYLKMVNGLCLHYYYYFIDKELGLCYLRVPTWCPFRVQFYFNAHNWLGRQLDKANIDYVLEDNAFTDIGDYGKAQQISDGFDVQQLHFRMNGYIEKYCPVAGQLDPFGYHWSIMQAEYASDVIFKDDKTVGKIYDDLLNTMVHAVQPEDIAKFLGRRGLHGKNNQEIETSCKQVRHHMRRIKHRMGNSSIKMYDKFGRVLRIETTTNDPTNFSHYRSVEHRDGTKTSRVAPVKKSIYSLRALAPIMRGCNNRYLKYIAAFDNPTIGKKRLDKVTKKSTVNNRTYKGFNFFDKNDELIMRTIACGDFIINGFRNKNIREKLLDKSAAQVSRIFKRLRVKGLIKKNGKSYSYSLTNLGYNICATVLNLKHIICNQHLCYQC